MAIKSKTGTAVSFDDLIDQIIAWVTDAAIHGENTWTVMRNAPWPQGTILRAKGRRPGEYQYIGLMPNTIIKGSTYPNWFFTKPNLATYFVWSKDGLNRCGADFSVSGTRISLKDSNSSYSFDAPDIFLSSAHVMHLGVFKQYASELDWNDQPGGITQDYSVFPVPYSYGQGKQNFSPPVLPGCEYPALSYEYEGLPLENFKYWLLKDDRRLIIVMNNAERWDMAYLGFLQPYDDKDENGAYAFPAIVIGGTSGLVSYGENMMHSPGQITPTPVIGLKFDYRPQEWSLSHGIPPFACTSAAGGPSQVRAMLPDGSWRSFANYLQVRQAIAQHVCAGGPAGYHFVRQAPTATLENNWIRPTEESCRDYTHVYCREPHQHLQADALQLYADGYGMVGSVPYLYFPSAPLETFGETTIAGKKYLAMPNVWKGRKFHLPGYAALVYHYDTDMLQNEDLAMDKKSRIMNLLIRMED